MKASARETAVLYFLASLFIAILPSPAHWILSAWTILLAGPTGSLKLFIAGLPDFVTRDAAEHLHFSPETIAVSLIGLLLWVTGGILLVKSAKRQWKPPFLAANLALWIAASAFNTYWFAIRSL